MSEPVLRVRALTRIYPGFRLGPIDLELTPGTVTAIVGPNGAGKTTTLRSILGWTRRDGGSVECSGTTGVSVGPRGFFERDTVGANLQLLGRVHESWSDTFAEELAGRLDLPLDERVGRLSKGGRAKLALVAALAHRPFLLLLDEPTEGLDPVIRSEFLDILRETQEEAEQAVLFCTHVLSDIGRLADELLFMNGGKFTLRASPVELTESWRRISYRLPDRPEHEQLVTGRRETTLAALEERGAQNVEVSAMSVEEIVVEILKQGGTDVAANLG